ncbi:MAG: anthranilate phosphoribosyltransferase [Gammaproteobacteria bacterium]|nr:anthranilate phosphoribosyltransferase [Gammaproteobacteria bacterium]
MDIRTALDRLVNRIDLDRESMRSVMQTIMQGEATPAQIGAFLVGLRMKGETVDEIAAAVEVMRSLATRVEVRDREHLVDTCGTGGDGMNTFNISTASAFVTAAAGAKVAKHGNRAVSSTSGSADVLEAAGVNLDLSPEQVAVCIDRLGVGFLFAPRHHGAMKHAVAPRRELGMRTLFNLLGPLSNPAAAPNQVLGVFSRDWLQHLAEVLDKLGSRHVMVVHAEDGLDEISLCAATEVAELNNSIIRQYRIAPEDFGLERCRPEALVAGDRDASLAMLKSALDGSNAAASGIVQLNAGAAIYVAGIAPDLAAGVSRAGDMITSGAASDRLQQFIDLTNSF